MKMIACRGRITAGQALAGMVAILTMLVVTQPSLAGGDDHRTLRLLLDKNIITQQGYDQAAHEEEREQKADGFDLINPWFNCWVLVRCHVLSKIASPALQTL